MLRDVTPCSLMKVAKISTNIVPAFFWLSVPEYGNWVFFRNVCIFLRNCMATHFIGRKPSLLQP